MVVSDYKQKATIRGAVYPAMIKAVVNVSLKIDDLVAPIATVSLIYVEKQ